MGSTLSIVTVCLNDRTGLERTLRSVVAQSWKGWELVVVDGGSTDGSVDVVRQHGSHIRAWVSEPDGGVYEAQNKGVGLASGDYCLFLNAGDHFVAEDVLERAFAAAPDEDVLYGDVVYSRHGFARRIRQADRPSIFFLMRSILPTQATMLRRELIERCGRHDTSLRIAADYDLLMKAFLVHRATARHVPVALSVHYQDGLSARPESRAVIARERAIVQQRYLPPLVLELHQQYLALRERTLARRLRALFRPMARRARSLGRWLRGKPDEG